MLRDLATLIAMPSAGDLIIYGTGAPEGNVSYVPEVGAHAGPSPDELHTFIVAPARVTVPPITHPIELYDLFIAYQETPTLITVASYNIHGGVGVDRRRDVDRLAAVIAEIQPDVIGLQEVIRRDGTVDADQPAYLASKLSMTMVMGATRPIGTGSFGNAILTRLPVIGSTTHDLSHGRYERRGCLRVDVAVDGAIVHVFNCHFGRAFKERREQLALLGSLLAITDVQGPRVLVGDFNEWHRGPITRGLRQFPSPTSRVCRTFPSYFPIFALDRIYWDSDLEGAACARTAAGARGSRRITCRSWRLCACARSASPSTRQRPERLARRSRAEIGARRAVPDRSAADPAERADEAVAAPDPDPDARQVVLDDDDDRPDLDRCSGPPGDRERHRELRIRFPGRFDAPGDRGENLLHA